MIGLTVEKEMYHSQDDVFDQLEREMRKLSDEALLQMFRLPGMSHEAWAPRVDVYETDAELIIKVCASGLKPKDIDVSLSADGKRLTVRGCRNQSESEKQVRRRYYQLEIYYGPFERVIHLPVDIHVDRDRLRATYRDGFLRIALPKVKPGHQSVVRSIPIEE